MVFAAFVKQSFIVSVEWIAGLVDVLILADAVYGLKLQTKQIPWTLSPVSQTGRQAGRQQ